MTEVNVIRCDGCSAWREGCSENWKRWSKVSVSAPVHIVPEVQSGKLRPAEGYPFVSNIGRDFCPSCTERLVAPLLSKAE